VTGAPAIVGTQVDRAISIATDKYWFTVREVQFLLRCSRSTVFRLLPAIAPGDKVKVQHVISPGRATRYWRLSPAAVRWMGHRIGRGSYL